MADVNFPVVQASSPDYHILNYQTGTDGITGKPILVQVVQFVERAEVPVTPTGGLTRHSVSSSAATALDDPTAGALYARVRAWHATGVALKRMYYRSDGTDPTANGANAFGYLMHGDVALVKVATKTNWKMIAETGEAFEVYVEWYNQ